MKGTCIMGKMREDRDKNSINEFVETKNQIRIRHKINEEMRDNFTLAIYDRERGIRLEKTVKWEDIDDGGVLLLYEKDFEVEDLDEEYDYDDYDNYIKKGVK
tara:strand:- start:28 stop:333 length:306 start_codon:yes stop_codon:yes gene_type:complete